MNLIIFLANAKTLKFENVESFNHNETDGLVRFKYISARDGETKTAVFNMNTIAGYSYKE